MSAGLQVVDAGVPRGLRDLVPAVSSRAIANSGFTERESFELYCPAAVGSRLYIDDELMRLTRTRFGDGWRWNPGFYAGTVRAELVPPGKSEGTTYLLDVAPDPQKLGQETYRQLIQEILNANPGILVGDEPATHSAAGSCSSGDPNLHYAYILQYGPALIAALRAVQRRPRRTLQSSRISVPPNRARKADVRTALLMARDGTLALLRDEDSSGGGEACRLDVPFSVESLDSAATRCLAACAHAVLRKALAVREKLDSLAAEELGTETRTYFKTRWEKRRGYLQSFIADLQRTLSQDPFGAARRREISAAGLTAVAADPLYSRAHRIAGKILRPGLPDTEGESWTWMSPTWGVYEAWCFIRLAQVLRELLPELRWDEPPMFERDRVALVVGTGEDIRVQVLYQKTFASSGGAASREFASISKELRPDLAITIERSGVRRWLVLDAKYSHARDSILSAMASAHLYHDALRWGGVPPYRSLLLVPSRDAGLEWLCERTFQADNGVGVVPCRPDAGVANEVLHNIRDLLGVAITSALTTACHP